MSVLLYGTYEKSGRVVTLINSFNMSVIKYVLLVQQNLNVRKNAPTTKKKYSKKNSKLDASQTCCIFNSFHWLFDCFLCCFCSTGVCSEYTINVYHMDFCTSTYGEITGNFSLGKLKIPEKSFNFNNPFFVKFCCKCLAFFLLFFLLFCSFSTKNIESIFLPAFGVCIIHWLVEIYNTDLYVIGKNVPTLKPGLLFFLISISSHFSVTN